MNKVYLDKTKLHLLTPTELTQKANFMTDKKPFTDFDYSKINPQNRLFGDHCSCCGNGEFILENTDEELIEIGLDNYSYHGGKRWIKCLKCGGISHL